MKNCILNHSVFSNMQLVVRARKNICRNWY